MWLAQLDVTESQLCWVSTVHCIVPKLIVISADADCQPAADWCYTSSVKMPILSAKPSVTFPGTRLHLSFADTKL